MLKIQTKALVNLKNLKLYSKYIGSNDSILLTEKGLLNFSKQLFLPDTKVFEGTPTIFSGSFLKELLKEGKDKIEVGFRTIFGKLVAFALKENPEHEWDREIVDFSVQLVPEATIEIPSRKGSKIVSSSALLYLLMFTDYEINFLGEVAYAYPQINQDLIFKFPNPFSGLEGRANGLAFKELKKFKTSVLSWKKEKSYLYIFNGATFFQKLEEPQEIEFPELPKKGWIKVNPNRLLNALENTFEWREPYRIKLENKKIIIRNKDKTEEISYYGEEVEPKEFLLSPEFIGYLAPLKKFSIVELNFAEDFVFLRYQKLQAVFKKAYYLSGGASPRGVRAYLLPGTTPGGGTSFNQEEGNLSA